IAVKSSLRYGKYSRIAGTGFCSASFGSQIVAANRAPSDIGIHTCSFFSISFGKDVTVFLLSESLILNTKMNSTFLSNYQIYFIFYFVVASINVIVYHYIYIFIYIFIITDY